MGTANYQADIVGVICTLSRIEKGSSKLVKAGGGLTIKDPMRWG
jgi:hypothetical protein